MAAILNKSCHSLSNKLCHFPQNLSKCFINQRDLDEVDCMRWGNLHDAPSTCMSDEYKVLGEALNNVLEHRWTTQSTQYCQSLQ